MVLESPERVADFLLDRYKQARAHYGDVLERPRDVHDMEFPAFVADNAQRIYDLAVRLKNAYPHIPDEEHALMAYILHVYSAGDNPIHAPHKRVVRAPRRFFLEYARKALGDEAFERLREENKYSGLAVAHLLERVPDHGLPEHVLKKRFLFR